MAIENVKGILIDVDGTVWAKGRPIPGDAEAISKLRAAGLGLMFFTNTDSKTAGQLAERLGKTGLAIGADDVFTAAGAATQAKVIDSFGASRSAITRL